MRRPSPDDAVTSPDTFPDRIGPDTIPADLDAEIARLERELAALKRTQADRAAAAFVLTLVRVIPPGLIFTAAELLDRAALDRELAEHLQQITTARQLGRRLARLARRPVVAGVRLECVGRDAAGCIWQMRVTSRP